MLSVPPSDVSVYLEERELGVDLTVVRGLMEDSVFRATCASGSGT